MQSSQESYIVDKQFQCFISTIKIGDWESYKKQFKFDYIDRKDRQGMTPLMWAAFRNKRTILEDLLKCGANPKIEDELDGWTCLHIAVWRGHTGIVSHLMTVEMEIDTVDVSDTTPVQLAINLNRKDCVKILNKETLKRILHDDGRGNLWEFQKLFPNKYMMFRDPMTGDFLIDSLANHDSDRIFDYLLSQPVVAEEVTQFQGLQKKSLNKRELEMTHKSLLFRAIKHGVIGPFERLYDLELINLKDLFTGKCALQISIDFGSRLMTKFIMKGVLDHSDWCQLQFDCETEQGRIVIDSVSKRTRKLKERYRKGLTRLHIAVLDGRPDVVKYILDADRDKVDAGNEDIGSPFYYSLVKGNDCFKSLFEYSPKLDFINKFSQTLMHVAIENDVHQSLDYLTKHLDNLDHVDYIGMNALHRAIVADNEDLCKSLMSKVQDWNLTIRPFSEDSPLTTAIASRDLDKSLYTKFTKWENSITLNIKSGNTIYPCFKDHLSSKELFFADDHRNTVMHLAVLTLNSDLCADLLNISTKTLEVRNKKGRTPLMEVLATLSAGLEIPTAAIEMVKLLVKYGSDVELLWDADKSILQYALTLNNEKILMALLLLLTNSSIKLFSEMDLRFCLQHKLFAFIDALLPMLEHKFLSAVLNEQFFLDFLAKVPHETLRKFYYQATCDVKQRVMDRVMLVAFQRKDDGLIGQLLKLSMPRWHVLPCGDTILTFFIRQHHMRYCCMLLELDSALELINTADSCGSLPIHVAIVEDFYGIICHFVGFVHDTDAEDCNGNTPLSLLVTKLNGLEHADYEIILATIYRLIDNGAQIDRVDEVTGKSPLLLCRNPETRSKMDVYNNRHKRNKSKDDQIPEGALSSFPSMTCQLCADNLKDCVLECGHTLCMTCGTKIDECPFCRAQNVNLKKIHF